MFTEEELAVISVAINYQLDVLEFIEEHDMEHNCTKEFLQILRSLQKRLLMPE